MNVIYPSARFFMKGRKAGRSTYVHKLASIRCFNTTTTTEKRGNTTTLPTYLTQQHLNSIHLKLYLQVTLHNQQPL